MVTVQNQRLRVIVTQSVWDSFAAAAKRLAGNQDPAQAQRGLVLSEAMNKLGNASELRMLENNPVDQEQVLSLAKKTLMFTYLSDKASFSASEIMMRYTEGHSIPGSMQDVLTEALAYADGQLGILTREQALETFRAFASEQLSNSALPDQRKQAHNLKLLELRTKLPREGRHAIERAEQAVAGACSAEISYRRSRVNLEGWDIEIIGQMPQQIGMCRYDQRVVV